MITKSERLKRSTAPYADHDLAKSDISRPEEMHAGQDSPPGTIIPKQVSEQAVAESSYTPQLLSEDEQAEGIAFGPVRLDMLGGLRQALIAHRDRRLQQFFDYWLTLAEARHAFPSRQTIDPLQMPRSLIPNLFITEVVYETGNQAHFRFRLLGQEITEREHIRPGDYVHELGGKHGAQSLEPHYLDCLKGRIWLRHTNLEWSDPHKSFIHYDVLLLPLARDGRDVDAMIGLVIYHG